MREILTAEERRRYARNIALDGVGEEGQRKLLSASVLIVGCGALGSVVAQYLAAAGVGRLRLIDFDTVDLSNLQRQILYSLDDCGRSKAECLARRLRDLNPGVTVETVLRPLRKADVSEMLSGIDVVVEATDNPSVKHFVPAEAMRVGIPCVCGGVSGWQGQVTTVLPGAQTDGYSALFGDVPDCLGPLTGCGSGGILGPAAGMVACAQAAEVIKLLTGAGVPLSSRLHLIDAFNGTSRTLKFA